MKCTFLLANVSKIIYVGVVVLPAVAVLYCYSTITIYSTTTIYYAQHKNSLSGSKYTAGYLLYTSYHLRYNYVGWTSGKHVFLDITHDL